jgi:intracellular sulfur oxidation DsrE/DsrF family protein
MKKLLFLIALLSSTYAFSQVDNGEKHKIVFQFVSGDTLSQHSLINNLKNLREGWPKAQVEIVFHGNGIFMVMGEKTKYAKELQDFVEKKAIKLVVCENTMRQKKVVREQILPFVGTVPMGIGEIVLKQEQGWSYLKAGL